MTTDRKSALERLLFDAMSAINEEDWDDFNVGQHMRRIARRLASSPAAAILVDARFKCPKCGSNHAICGSPECPWASPRTTETFSPRFQCPKCGGRHHAFGKSLPDCDAEIVCVSSVACTWSGPRTACGLAPPVTTTNHVGLPTPEWMKQMIEPNHPPVTMEPRHAEESDDINYPKSYSFDDVNNFVHGSDTHYEELQGACLGMATEIERLQSAATKTEPAREASDGERELPLPTGERATASNLAWIMSGMAKVGRTSVDIHVFDYLRAEVNALKSAAAERERQVAAMVKVAERAMDFLTAEENSEQLAECTGNFGLWADFYAAIKPFAALVPNAPSGQGVVG